MTAHNFNPRSPHGERHAATARNVDDGVISIHAPRTGSDCTRWMPCPATAYFNPRSPHGERRLYGSHARRLHHFNPRSPHGERHIQMFIGFARQRFQSTLPARGATARLWVQLSARSISIHAPRTGSDRIRAGSMITSTDFNPRSPHGERPGRFVAAIYEFVISIHAPRTGSDPFSVPTCWNGTHFNPRSPHGERRWKTNDCFAVGKFQSTLPARGATRSALGITRKQADFNPRSPHGERPLTVFFPTCGKLFQSTLPARGATQSHGFRHFRATFQSTLPARGATRVDRGGVVRGEISIHAPRTGSDVTR